MSYSFSDYQLPEDGFHLPDPLPDHYRSAILALAAAIESCGFTRIEGQYILPSLQELYGASDWMEPLFITIYQEGGPRLLMALYLEACRRVVESQGEKVVQVGFTSSFFECCYCGQNPLPSNTAMDSAGYFCHYSCLKPQYNASSGE